MKKHSLSALALATALTGSLAHAATNEMEQNPRKSISGAAGFTSGAIVGGLAAGPIGAVIGAVGGSLFGERESGHVASKQALNESQSAIYSLEQEIDMHEAKIAELEQDALARMELKVFFDTGVDQVSELDEQRLKTMADYMEDNQNVDVRLSGHADPRGTDEYNNILSRERATTVKTILVDRGIDEARIRTDFHGSSRSAAPKGDLQAYSRERRVDIELSPNADISVSQR